MLLYIFMVFLYPKDLRFSINHNFNSMQGWVSLLLKFGHFAASPAVMQSITKHSSGTERTACLVQQETAAGRQDMGKVAMTKSIFRCQKDPGLLSHEGVQLCK